MGGDLWLIEYDRICADLQEQKIEEDEFVRRLKALGFDDDEARAHVAAVDPHK